MSTFARVLQDDIVSLLEEYCYEDFHKLEQILGMGAIHVTIRPKIKLLPLLHLLRYTYGLRFLDLFDSTNFEIEALSFQDLLICQLEREARELLARGLHRTYVRREEMLSSPRGMISIPILARRGGVIQAALPCHYYTHIEDHLLNEILLAGLQLGAYLTRSDILQTRLQTLVSFHFAEISSIRLSRHTLQHAYETLSRLTALYTPAVKLIELLLEAQGITLAGSEPELPLPEFLFDMNVFFQDLLQRFLQEYVPEYQLLPQYEITDVLSYTENPRQKRPPELRPDYIVRHRGKILAILDAKYRDLWEHDLPPHMLYQLVMYSLSHTDCNQATILYPTTQPRAKEAKIEVRLSAQRQSYVILRPVNLLHLDRLVVNRGNETHEQACKEWTDPKRPLQLRFHRGVL